MPFIFRNIALLAFMTTCLMAGQPQDALGQDTNLTLLGHLPYNQELSDVWGYVDEEGNEYALVGTQFGFSIVDVTDAAAPVERWSAPGSDCIWRDVKTWGDFAYVTNDCGPGLLIVDLSPLPDTAGISYSYWIHDSVIFYRAHNLYIDENGFAYLFGTDHGVSTAILDVKDHPWDPELVGLYTQDYLHDGFVRGDTLWGSAVYAGELQVIDVTDKANPTKVSAWKTPGAFTHNAWLSDDGRHIYTTDEIENGVIAAYDVEDIQNPEELDRWGPGDTAIIPHNVHFFQDYLVVSHYTVGLVVLDASHPNALVRVGGYDTSPDYHYEGFHGCWGAYPWLPSGNILATDIETGLFIFDPHYTRASFLQGRVTDLHTGGGIFFPRIRILGDSTWHRGDISGHYSIGTMAAGTYTVVVTADMYFPDTIEGVVLTAGEVTELNVALNNWPSAIHEQEDVALPSVFPNPVADAFSLRNDLGYDQLQVFDEQGQLVQTCTLAAGLNQVYLPAALPPQLLVLVFHRGGKSFTTTVSHL